MSYDEHEDGDRGQRRNDWSTCAIQISYLVQGDEQLDWLSSQTNEEYCRACVATNFWHEINTVAYNLVQYCFLLVYYKAPPKESQQPETPSLGDPMNTHHWGKDHCMAGLQLLKFGFSCFTAYKSNIFSLLVNSCLVKLETICTYNDRLTIRPIQWFISFY